MPRLGNKLIIAVALGAAIFVGMSLWANVHEISDALRRLQRGYIPLVLVLALLNYLTRFLKWEVYRRTLQIVLPIRVSLLVFLSGLVMSVTPGKFGEVLKSYLLKRANGTAIRRSAPIVLAERFTDFIALILLSSAGTFAFAYGGRLFAISVLLIVGVLVLVSSKTGSARVLRTLRKVPLFSGMARALEEAYRSIFQLLHWNLLLPTTLISVVAWFWECLGFYLILHAFDTSLPLFDAAFVYAFSTIAGAVTMLPGGLGATEAGMAGLLVGFHTPKPDAVASVLVVRVCTLWFAVLVGLGALWRFRRPMSVPKA